MLQQPPPTGVMRQKLAPAANIYCESQLEWLGRDITSLEKGF